jgi:hypothetical protein
MYNTRVAIRLNPNHRAGAIHPKEPLTLPDVHVVAAHVETTEVERAPGEGTKRAAGAWSVDPQGLDAYLRLTRELRKASPRMIEP